MGIGVVAIQTTQKKEPSGSPFTPGSARNGTSVDSTGRVVLGNDVGEVGSPAQLISDREIITEDNLNLFRVILDSIITGVTTALDGQSIRIAGGNAVVTTIEQISGINANATVLTSVGANGSADHTILSGAGGDSLFRIATDVDDFRIVTDGNGHILFRLGPVLDIWAINTTTFFTQIGPTLVNDNGATLQVSGTVTNRHLLQGQGVGTYNVDRDTDTGKLFTNSAAANLQLPNMVGANVRTGFILRVTCTNVAGVTITTSVGQTIRFGSLSTSLSGTISSTDVGAYIIIVLVDQATWVTESFNGAWVLT